MLDALACNERRLLIVDPCSECEKIIPILTMAGWTVNLAELGNLKECQCDVGLVRLQTAHLESLESIKQMIDASATEWVAALSHDLMMAPGIKELIGEWFFDFHTLPFEPQRLQMSLGRAFGMARVKKLCTRPLLASESDLMIGNSPSTDGLRALLSKLAPTTSPVLIQGESGTGKELVARTLHRRSTRSKGPFIAINCGAIATNLIQSELFGHEKGAFTGAHQRKIGRIEAADGGTLFLDEIGDLPLDMQTNLLRFMQEMCIERVGGHASINVSVRILAATHVDLEKAVVEGRFREDLYYRLNVLQVQTTPLRQRVQDILPLAQHFSRLYSSEVGRRPRPFSDGAISAMLAYPWRGNVRELANRVRRGQVLSEGRQIEAWDLGLKPYSDEAEQQLTLEEHIFQAERKAIDQALIRCSRHMTKAARSLGVSRPTFYRLLHKHRILGDIVARNAPSLEIVGKLDTE